MSKIKILCIVTVVSLAIVLGTLFFSEHSGVTFGTFYNHMTETPYYFADLYGKGYPFIYYISSGSDYGANFMVKPFFINLLGALFIIWCGLFLVDQRFSKKQGM